MYNLLYANKFKKDYKLIKKRKYKLELLHKIFAELEKNSELPRKYKPHKLINNYVGYWECHIRPDWLLIYKIDEINKIITLARTGTHSDLF